MKTVKLILAKLHVKPEKLNDFRNVYPSLVSGSRNEPGNIEYTLFCDVDEPNRFVVVERWKDQLSIDFHNAQPHFKTFLEFAADGFASAPDIKVYDIPAE